jgi:hypothetical protein
MSENGQAGDEQNVTADVESCGVNVSWQAPTDALAATPDGATVAPPFGAFGAPERRAAQRYLARDVRGWIGWYEGATFRELTAWIVNISAAGTLVATDTPPPADRAIWLRLDNPAVPDWAAARVVRIHTSASGLHAARLVFQNTCPYELIKGVAFSPRSPGAGAFESKVP